MGLSISKKLTQLLGGDIAVKSEVNKGSIFTIHLPLPMADENTVKNSIQDNQLNINLHGLEILVVDDEPFNLMLAEVILKKHGANITVAENGRVALEKIDLQNFDLVLADLHMPEVDGYMLANKIRERYLQVPLIALTANVMQNDVIKIKQSGFNDILLKPYKEKSLLEMISKHAPIVIGDKNIKQETALSTENENPNKMSDALYNLTEIRKFADNDNSILVAIIDSFIQNNSLNLFTLKDAIEKHDLHTVRNTAHKMLPSYNHFHIMSIIPELKEMEIVEVAQNNVLLQQYYKIEEVSKDVFAALESESRVLALN